MVIKMGFKLILVFSENDNPVAALVSVSTLYHIILYDIVLCIVCVILCFVMPCYVLFCCV